MYPNGLDIEKPIQAKERTYQERESILTMKEQVPDKEFTKFVDSPDPPLPFWVVKIMMAIAAVGGAGWAAFRAYQIETWQFIAAGIKENVPGVPFVILTFGWLASAIGLICSKRSKGAASVAGLCMLFAAGTTFMEQSTYPDDPLLLCTIISAACAVITLISAAGGISINLDDQAF